MEKLIEVTPEIKEKAIEVLKATRELRDLIFGQDSKGSISVQTLTGKESDELNIFDRHEIADDGTDLGFYAHEIYCNGNHKVKFIAEDNEAAQAFLKEWENGENK